MSKEDKSKAAAANPQEALQKEIELIARGQHSDPFAVLGPHWTEQDGKKSLAIRVFRPNAAEVTVLWGKKAEAHRTVRIHPEGVFEAQIPASGAGKSQSEAVAPGAYRLRIRFSDGNVFETYDPYAFPPLLTDYDLYLSGEGTHYQKYEKLGRARARSGWRSRRAFRRVGAERAARQRRRRFQFLGRPRAPDAHARPRPESGNFLSPAWMKARLYKFEILSRAGTLSGLKSDPYGFAGENAAEQCVRGRRHRRLPVERHCVAGLARRLARLAAFADVDLRIACGLMAAQGAKKAIAGSPIANSPTN